MTPPRPGRLQGPGQLQVGWQYATAYPDPGRRRASHPRPEAERLSPDWIAAQRREESRLNRPLQALFGVAVVLGLVLAALARSARSARSSPGSR